MLLVGKKEIDVPLAGGIEGVFAGALTAGLGADSDIPADRTLQDRGHVVFSP
jgi:hypothetical protein